MDANGFPRLGGLLLSNTNIRDGTFAVMGTMGIKARFALPALTDNDPRVTNVIETLESMRRAGLFSTNQLPNPYE